MARVEVNGWYVAAGFIAVLVPFAIWIGSIEKRRQENFEATINQSLAEMDREYAWDRTACRFTMRQIALAEFTYRGTTKKDFTDDIAALDAITVGGFSCPQDGKYSVTLNKPLGSFTVHCSFAPHDKGAYSEPDGFSPAINER